MKLHTLLFFFILNLLTSCKGQNIQRNAKINTTNTLSDTVSELCKSIWIVFQATNGDYWFGSDTNGVYRFDGKTIINYSTKVGLSSNRIRGIQEDKQGNIYFTTLEGINKFDGHTFAALNAIKSNSLNDNWKLQPDDLWFCILGKNGEEGPYRYDGKTLYHLTFPKHYLEDESYSANGKHPWSPYDVYYIYKDSKGTIWFGTAAFGICRYDGNSLSWLYEDHLTNTPEGGSFGIRSIIEDAQGKFWFCNTRYRYNISPDITTKNGSDLIKYEKEKGIDGINFAPDDDHVYFMSVIKDDNEDLWLATYSQGVWRYDGKKARHYPVKDGTKDITLFSIYKDRQGEIWLGTHETGAYKFNGKTFEKFKP